MHNKYPRSIASRFLAALSAVSLLGACNSGKEHYDVSKLKTGNIEVGTGEFKPAIPVVTKDQKKIFGSVATGGYIFDSYPDGTSLKPNEPLNFDLAFSSGKNGDEPDFVCAKFILPDGTEGFNYLLSNPIEEATVYSPKVHHRDGKKDPPVTAVVCMPPQPEGSILVQAVLGQSTTTS